MKKAGKLGQMLLLTLTLLASLGQLRAQTVTVRGRVEVIAGADKKQGEARGTKAAEAAREIKLRHEKTPATAVWLTAAPGADVRLDPPAPIEGGQARLTQRNKAFEPRLLVIPAGSKVDFPNRDPFFHNVFSLFEGKRFDLGLYEAGTTRAVRFDRPGISYIFCNIHPEMNAVVITLATPLYAIAGSDGQVSIPNVPYGRYTLHVWSEGMEPDKDKLLTREITIAEGSESLGVIQVPETSSQRIAHKNKYGRDYDEPTPDTSLYPQR